MKYSKDLTEEICKYLQGGNNRTDTCDLVGISFESFNQWMNDERKPEFSESIKLAEAKCKGRCIALVQKAALTSWQAAAWWLERKHQNEFAIKYKLEHGGKDGGPIEVVNYTRSKIRGMTKEQLKTLVDKA